MVTLLIAARRYDDGMTAVLLSSDATLQPGARESLAESYLGFFYSAPLFILRSSKTFFNDNFKLQPDGREIERERYINCCTCVGLLWDIT